MKDYLATATWCDRYGTRVTVMGVEPEIDSTGFKPDPETTVIVVDDVPFSTNEMGKQREPGDQRLTAVLGWSLYEFIRNGIRGHGSTDISYWTNLGVVLSNPLINIGDERIDGRPPVGIITPETKYGIFVRGPQQDSLSLHLVLEESNYPHNPEPFKGIVFDAKPEASFDLKKLGDVLSARVEERRRVIEEAIHAQAPGAIRVMVVVLNDVLFNPLFYNVVDGLMSASPSLTGPFSNNAQQKLEASRTSDREEGDKDGSPWSEEDFLK